MNQVKMVLAMFALALAGVAVASGEVRVYHQSVLADDRWKETEADLTAIGAIQGESVKVDGLVDYLCRNETRPWTELCVDKPTLKKLFRERNGFGETVTKTMLRAKGQVGIYVPALVAATNGGAVVAQKAPPTPTPVAVANGVERDAALLSQLKDVRSQLEASNAKFTSEIAVAKGVATAAKTAAIAAGKQEVVTQLDGVIKRISELEKAKPGLASRAEFDTLKGELLAAQNALRKELDATVDNKLVPLSERIDGISGRSWLGAAALALALLVAIGAYRLSRRPQLTPQLVDEAVGKVLQNEVPQPLQQAIGREVSDKTAAITNEANRATGAAVIAENAAKEVSTKVAAIEKIVGDFELKVDQATRVAIEAKGAAGEAKKLAAGALRKATAIASAEAQKKGHIELPEEFAEQVAALTDASPRYHCQVGLTPEDDAPKDFFEVTFIYDGIRDGEEWLRFIGITGDKTNQCLKKNARSTIRKAGGGTSGQHRFIVPVKKEDDLVRKDSLLLSSQFGRPAQGTIPGVMAITPTVPEPDTGPDTVSPAEADLFQGGDNKKFPKAAALAREIRATNVAYPQGGERRAKPRIASR